MYYLKKEVFSKFIVNAMGNSPKEACGLLVVNTHMDLIDSFIPIPNISINPNNQYFFDPKIFIPLIFQLKKRGVEWIGVIHSHPNTKAYPSTLDIANWHFSDKSYWIYSLKDAELKSYFIKRQEVIPVDFQIVD